MPNHITNRIEFYGEQENINKVLELIKGEEECIDFNKIIPMPKELNITSSSNNDAAIICYLSNKLTVPFEELDEEYLKYVTNMFDSNYASNIYHERLPNRKEDFDELYDLGQVCCGNIHKYGYVDWYDWCRETWGTKWNAYDVLFDEDNNAIEFDTAWSCPLPVLDKLAEICYNHGVSFTGKWADEDCGSNIGIFESDCDGDEYWFSYEYMEDYSNEAYNIYVELKGESQCMGKDENGNWIHYDCDDCPNKDVC